LSDVHSPPKVADIKSNIAGDFLKSAALDAKSSATTAKKSIPKVRPAKKASLVQRAGIISGTFLLTGGALAYFSREGTEDDKLLDPEHRTSSSFYSRYQRILYRSKALYRFFTEPISNKLLPEPLPNGQQPPYTLVLNLHDTLVHSQWDREHGWRIQIRPGVQYFLFYLSQFYEIVLFTSAQGYECEPILEKVDPYGGIMYRLFRESTRYVKGKLVKDLSYLNRDLSKILIIDWNADSVSEQPDNAILIDRWMGDEPVHEQSTEKTLTLSSSGGSEHDFLIRLIPFLETLAMSGMDVRKVIEDYKGKNIPDAFAENMKQYKARVNGTAAAQLESSPEQATEDWGTTIVNWTKMLFGISATSTAPNMPPSSTIDENDIYADQKRHHEMFIQHIVERQGEIEQQRQWAEEQQKKQMQLLSENKMTVWELLTQGPPKEVMDQLNNPQGYPGQQPQQV
jgi:import inner membrane translocase subunit TIM50